MRRNVVSDIFNKLINTDMEKITRYIVDVSEQVVKDYQQNFEFLRNNENKIRNVILERYLKKSRNNHNMMEYRFEAEAIENYNEEEQEYKGRTDIRIIKKVDFEKDEAYYTVECKKIDGKNGENEKNLNQQYVNEGINRFVTKKYSSYYGKNIMWGFVIKKIDITQNVNLIQDIQNKHSNEHLHGEFCFVDKKNTSQRYKSVYNIQSEKLELWHIFSDFSDIVE